jgi:hypothetical protein
LLCDDSFDLGAAALEAASGEVAAGRGLKSSISRSSSSSTSSSSSSSLSPIVLLGFDSGLACASSSWGTTCAAPDGLSAGSAALALCVSLLLTRLRSQQAALERW